MTRCFPLVASVAFILIGASSAAGQVCRPLDRDGRQFQYMMGTYSGGNAGTAEGVTRESLRLAAVPASQVNLVTQAATCKKANAAYQSELAGAGTGFSNQVYVLQIGDTYAVADPDFYIGPPMSPHDWAILIMDAHFKVLSGM